jgi:hypothetical protein
MKRRDLVNTLEKLLGDSFDSSELVYLSDAELADKVKMEQEIAEDCDRPFRKFPNGFSSWQETHYEVVQAITLIAQKDEPYGIVQERREAQGHGGLYELAEELTDEFERTYTQHFWHGEFFDTIEEWLNEKLK